jgi:hypothetical protein
MISHLDAIAGTYQKVTNVRGCIPVGKETARPLVRCSVIVW